MKKRPPPPQHMAGFTLVEMVIVIVVTGILAAIVAIFIRAPVQGYFDSVRRAELTDQADVALRRITRDVRLALPNSLRVAQANVAGVDRVFIEFIMTRSGGRYRDPGDGSIGGDFLSFDNAADLTFDVHGPMPAITPGAANGDFLVVFNLGPGNNPANAYATGDVCANCNRTRITGVAGNTVTLAGNPFAAQVPPQASPNGRFQVVPGDVRAVSYNCPVQAAAAADLTRHWNYGFVANQPTPPVGGAQAVLAAGASCAVNFLPAVGGRNGLLEITLTLASGGEAVTLAQQIRVDNAP